MRNYPRFRSEEIAQLAAEKQVNYFNSAQGQSDIARAAHVAGCQTLYRRS